ncbi:MAG: glycosyltransferase family 4 protein [Candidatus Berkelbacteria bacterium]
MKIAIVAPIAIKIPPDKYGGSEFVVYYLTEELVKRGHEVDLYATGDSKTSANLVGVVPTGLWNTQDFKDIPSCCLSMLYQLVDSGKKYDVIHEHLGPYGTVLSRLTSTPVLTTLHTPVTRCRAKLYEQVKDNFYLASISDNQRKDYPDLNYIDTVYNGVPVNDYEFSSESGEYLCFLGRFDNIKGAREAIDLALATGEKLVMAAKIEDEEYFKKYVEPKIDNEKIVYIGEVDFKQKVELLKNAKALVSLINWDEPFGLVVPEANACGTPVIVNPRGAFPELVEDGLNGFITDGSPESAIEAVGKISQIDRAKCRKFVEEKFSIEKMVDNYEAVYKKMAGIKNEKA